MTLVPAMATTAAAGHHAAASPTYVVSRPDEDVIANTLLRVLPDRVAYGVTRRKNVALQQMIYKRSRGPSRRR